MLTQMKGKPLFFYVNWAVRRYEKINIHIPKYAQTMIQGDNTPKSQSIRVSIYAQDYTIS